MHTVKIAFAGFRHAHIFDLYERVRNDSTINITAAYEASPEGLQAMKKAGIPVTHTDFDRFLAECGADIIAIGDYYAARGDEIIKALRAHKHIISDKPLCTASSQLREIETLSRENSLSVFIMLELRYHPQFAAAKELIGNGKIGEVKNIQFNGAHDIDIKNRPHWYFEGGKHGGTINDLAVHGIDMVRYLTGLEPGNITAAVTSNAYAHEYPDFHDSAAFLYTLENGALVTADTSYCTPAGGGYAIAQYWRFNIWGTLGCIEVNEASGEARLLSAGTSEYVAVKGKAVSSDALCDLISEINGKPGILTTADSLAAASTALALQEHADKYNSERKDENK